MRLPRFQQIQLGLLALPKDTWIIVYNTTPGIPLHRAVVEFLVRNDSSLTVTEPYFFSKKEDAIKYLNYLDAWDTESTPVNGGLFVIQINDLE